MVPGPNEELNRGGTPSFDSGRRARVRLWQSFSRLVVAADHHRPTDCAWFAQEYDDLCGQNGPEVFNTLCIFLKALGFASRRQIAIG